MQWILEAREDGREWLTIACERSFLRRGGVFWETVENRMHDFVKTAYFGTLGVLGAGARTGFPRAGGPGRAGGRVRFLARGGLCRAHSPGVPGRAVYTFPSTTFPTVRTKGRFVRTVGKPADGKVYTGTCGAPRSVHGREGCGPVCIHGPSAARRPRREVRTAPG